MGALVLGGAWPASRQPRPSMSLTAMVCSSLERARALEVAKELRRPYTFQALDIDDGSIILHLKSPISSPDIPYRFSFGVPLSLSTHYITTRRFRASTPDPGPRELAALHCREAEKHEKETVDAEVALKEVDHQVRGKDPTLLLSKSSLLSKVSPLKELAYY
ncbi:hypothetical protein BU26DRAFT_581784 [Trematosphaeria pertusa]|uniref:Uncharacterized protein n=1 Tax=Trematosphaeria pertusa TaxID=390896 RepID=A0A6A6I0Y4_9PLEO|nr:uncharacterized protein BU26DRAFT_581784 [Trematosphaeria pertusa]KAF2243563.1 hypothetical protein BU26DRAFT_581784 [Trematosphaeria pertusa]